MPQTDVDRVASRFAELCQRGQYKEAMEELYCEKARHVEACEMPGMPRITEGKPALRQKSEQFFKSNTIHSQSCGEARVNGDQFACEMSMDVTCKEGPMAGQRVSMSETGLYTVKDGKIVEGKFFYAMGPK